MADKPYKITCIECKKVFCSSNPYVRKHKGCKRPTRSRYPKEFYRKRISVWARDKFICLECGRFLGDDIRNHPVHHVDGNVSNNKLENLVTLCSPCHVRLHRSGLKAFRVPKFVDETNLVYSGYKREKKNLFRGI